MRTVSWLYNNAQTLLLAFGLAVVVWVSATTESDPNQEVVFRAVPLEVVGKEEQLLISDQIPTQVNVTIYAPSSKVSLLERRIASLGAKISLKGLPSGTYKVPVEISYDVHPARLVRVEPAYITIELEKIIQHALPIQLSVIGKPALGYEAGKAEINLDEASITGAETQVNKVNELRVTANIGSKDDVFEDTLPIVALDALGTQVSGVEVLPKTVQFRQTINLLKGYRNKVVRVVTTGEVAEGYRLEDILVYPLKTLLFSPDPQLLDKMLGYIETEPLDLKKTDKDLDTRLTLKLPEGISVVGDQTVRVRVRLAAIESSLALKLPLEVIGLAPPLAVDVAIDSVDVFLAGPLPVLSNLQGKDVRVLLDLTDLDAGKHKVIPRVDILPSDVRMLSITPSDIDVVIVPQIGQKQTATLVDTPSKESETVTPTLTKTPRPSRTPSMTNTLPPTDEE